MLLKFYKFLTAKRVFVYCKVFFMKGVFIMKISKRFMAVTAAGVMLFCQSAFAKENGDIAEMRKALWEQSKVYLNGAKNVLNGGEVVLNSDEAMELLLKYNEISSDIKSMTMDMEGVMNMKAKSNGESFDADMSLSGKAKEIIKSPTDAVIEMNMNMNMSAHTDAEDYGSENISYSMYYNDNYMYTDIMGNKMKMQVPISEAMEQFNQIGIDIRNMSAELIEDYVDDVRAKILPNGNKELSYTMDIDEFMNSIGNSLLFGGQDEMIGALDFIDCSDVKVTMLLDKNNYPVSETMSYVMSINIDENTKADYTVDFNIDISDINSTEIVLPDLSGYIDMQEAMGLIGGSDGPTVAVTAEI